jgi:hypothetical protein
MRAVIFFTNKCNLETGLTFGKNSSILLSIKSDVGRSAAI